MTIFELLAGLQLTNDHWTISNFIVLDTMSSDVQQPGSRKPKSTDWGSVVEREEAMIDHKMRMR